MTSIDTRQQLEAALAMIPERARTIYLLSARDGLSYATIARQLGMNVVDVEQLLAQALVAIDRHYGTNTGAGGVASGGSSG